MGFKNIRFTLITVGAGIAMIMNLSSCKKYLDEKPTSSLQVPSSLADLQALLDRSNTINQNAPRFLEALTDNYYLPTTTWQGRSVIEQLNYIWADNQGTENSCWNATYDNPIYYSNTVLGVLPDIKFDSKDVNSFNNIRGSALFYRAFAFYEIAQLYCKPYSTTSNTDLGIVLRLNSNINTPSVRATVKQTYDQILNDFKTAATLLPETAIYPTRPTKAAAFGALARTYLAMGDYSNAGKYADSALAQNATLIDYNNFNASANPVFPKFNTELLFYNRCVATQLTYGTFARIDSSLYQSYDANDLRKKLFFKLNTDGAYSFQGSYEGTTTASFYNFDGLAVDEMYLIRAESFARAGNKDAAMNDLNTMMQKRWTNTVSWAPITATDAQDALNKILVERRKELVYRGLRWTDLRRFNLEGANITLKRVVNNTTYTLPSNDPRWVLLIPQAVIQITGMPQNPR